MKTVYGPVASWRLGRSLGIDLICGPKACSFDCTYCQLGKTINKTAERGLFVESAEAEKSLEDALKLAEADIVTFSGSGEPTLAKNIGECIGIAKRLTDLPIAVLTNSSLLGEKDVRRELSGADEVVAKLDAPNQELFEEINVPVKGITFENTLVGIKKFRKGFKGKFALQCMFLERNRDRAGEIAELAMDIMPDEVEINTPYRPSREKPLGMKEIMEIKGEFGRRGLNAISIYDKERPEVKVLDIEETRKRRPSL